ncbi:MAG TPA: HWE histidine kinase domain-containing protein [Reyranella sp.]|nr:HWE histidine kinase domain-containing protein [Reyranella sp.]
MALPLLLLVGLLLYRSVVLEREQLERRIIQVLDALVADVDRDIDRHLTVLHTLATSPAIAAEDWQSLYKQAKRGLSGKTYLVLIDADGHQLVNTYVPYGRAPEMTGDPATLQTIRRTGQPVVSDLFVSLVVHAPVYNISIPILRDGKLAYVMSLGLLPEDLRQLLDAEQVQADWTTTIWDRKGIILARSRDHDSSIATKVSPDRLQHPPRTVFASTNFEGKRVLAVTARSGLSDWTIGVSYPAELVDRQVRQSLLFWGITIAVFAALVVVLAVVFGRQIAVPLAAARQAAESLGRGEPVTVASSTVSEVNAVNHALHDAQLELQRSLAALNEHEEQLRTAADAAQFGAHQYDVANDRSIRSPQLRQILGVDDAGDATFESGLALVHPDDRAAVRLHKEQILASEENYQLAYRIRRPDGEVRWVMDRGKVIRDAWGKAQRVVGVLLDITDLKAAEQRQRLLFDELNHRVKNTLAIVQSLAQQTLRTKPGPEEFAGAFEDRLASLARAHNLLTRESWRGATLDRIVHNAMEPFADSGGRITVEGPTVVVPAGSTITLCLMLHELATNAARYGALSTPQGNVAIAWSLSRNGALLNIDLQWHERNGPTVSPPTRKGFGSRLLAASARQLNAELGVDYDPAGVRYRLRFAVPVSQMVDFLGSQAADAVSAS